MIFLDEPSTGLDLPSRQAMWQVISELAGSGVTIFLTTQYLEEADRLAGRVAILDGGRIVAEGTTAELKERVAGQRLDLVRPGGGVRGGSPAPGRPRHRARSVRPDPQRPHRRLGRAGAGAARRH